MKVLPVVPLVLGALVTGSASEHPVDDARLTSVFVAPSSPWRAYSEPNADDFLGVHPFAAFALQGGSGGSQTVALYTSPNGVVGFDALGNWAQGAARSYRDAVVSEAKLVPLCQNRQAWSFEYTAVIENEKRDVIEEYATSESDIFLVKYARPAGTPADPQAMRTLASLCTVPIRSPVHHVPEPTPTPAPANWKPTAQDYQSLKRFAIDRNWPDRATPVRYIAKSPSEMPPFDPNAFYEGREAGFPQNAWTGFPEIAWISTNRNDTSSDRRPLRHALVLAAMDTLAAGPGWKAIYDRLRAQDEAQPATAPDRYRARHAFLALMDREVATLEPSFPVRVPDPALDAEARAIDPRELSQVIRGIYQLPATLEQVPGDVPPPYYMVYRGRADGKFVVLTNKTAIERAKYADAPISGIDDDSFATNMEASADSGAAGPVWKQRFDAAPDKTRFGHVLARAVVLTNQDLAAKAHAGVAWIHATIPLGSSRAQTFALLDRRALKLSKGSSAYVTFLTGFYLGCGTEMSVSFTFDVAERLTAIQDGPQRLACR
jgi:hypothetical protein